MTSESSAGYGKILGSCIDGPTHDERSLVFALRDPKAAKSFLDGEVPFDAVNRVRAYIKATGALLTPLFAAESESSSRKHWMLGNPAPRSVDGEFVMHYHLELVSSSDRSDLEADLRKDPRIAFANRPAVFYPLPEAHRGGPPLAGAQWALAQCKFGPDVWDRLEQHPAPGPIAIIDAGGQTRHPELEGVVEYVGPPSGDGALSNHAAKVAGVIAAIRGNEDENGTGVTGCCSAKLRVYNTWTKEGFDSKAFYAALDAVVRERPPVLNFSLGSCTSDAMTDCLIQRCVESGVVVVAAMGDYAPQGSPPLFPAAHCGVVAVGGTTRFDEKTNSSSTGCHIWISAPGEDILTVSGDDAVVEADGTSYSTAMVSAAVWLARRANKDLSPADIRDLLAKSVDGKSVPNGGHSAELGYGRLDMEKLADIVAPKRP
jgi:subtilisin/minor extracellular protease Epr